jgi:5-formyltetrahydrofolate cyclo-ligase
MEEYFSGKPPLRREIWSLFPPAKRIPQFPGARAAAEKLFELPELKTAKTLKVNRDRAQAHVRRFALERGIVLFIATHRLGKGFLRLDPHTRKVSRVAVEDVPPLDGVIVGSVAVTRTGYQCGVGFGYCDVEYAILRMHGHGKMPVYTTVMREQIVRLFPYYEHDVSLSAFATPDELVVIDFPGPSPKTIDWTGLPDELLDEMPILQKMRRNRKKK